MLPVVLSPQNDWVHQINPKLDGLCVHDLFEMVLYRARVRHFVHLPLSALYTPIGATENLAQQLTPLFVQSKLLIELQSLAE